MLGPCGRQPLPHLQEIKTECDAPSRGSAQGGVQAEHAQNTASAQAPSATTTPESPSLPVVPRHNPLGLSIQVSPVAHPRETAAADWPEGASVWLEVEQPHVSEGAPHGSGGPAGGLFFFYLHFYFC